jgi:hypothetical protein
MSPGTQCSRPSTSSGRRAAVLHGPKHQRGQATESMLSGSSMAWAAGSAGTRRSQWRGPVVVAAPTQARVSALAAPDGTVLGAHRWVSQAGGCRRRCQRSAHSRWKVVFGQQRLRIGPAQKVHVGAGRLLRRVVPCSSRRNVPGWGELTMARRRISSGRWLASSRPPRRPSRARPGRSSWPFAAFRGDQRHDVLHKVLGAVGRHIGRVLERQSRAGWAPRSESPRSRLLCEVFQQGVPDKGCFGEPVQEYQHRATAFASGAAAQRNAVGQLEREGLNHGPARPAGGPIATAIAPFRPGHCFFRAENSLTSPPPACSRVMDSALGPRCGVSLSDLVSRMRNFRPSSTRGRMTSSRDVVQLGQPVSGVAQQDDAGQVGAADQVVGHHLLPACLVGATRRRSRSRAGRRARRRSRSACPGQTG